MYCKECGKIIDDDALFCSECGTKISKVTESTMVKAENKMRAVNWIKIIVIMLVVIAFITSIIVPVNNYKQENEFMEEVQDFFNYETIIKNVDMWDLKTIEVEFVDHSIWENKRIDKLDISMCILESGAVADLDSGGTLSFAKGYSFDEPDWSYYAETKENAANDKGYYSLCIGSSDEYANTKQTMDISLWEDIVLDINRVYNIYINITYEGKNLSLKTDNYYRFVDGQLVKVNYDDLAPEDVYFAWKDNGLHFAHFSDYNNGNPRYYVSDEVYDMKE